MSPNIIEMFVPSEAIDLAPGPRVRTKVSPASTTPNGAN